ncbi:MAG: hypothetical protein AABP62_14400 [Planctomycetota bacterium]
MVRKAVLVVLLFFAPNLFAQEKSDTSRLEHSEPNVKSDMPRGDSDRENAQRSPVVRQRTGRDLVFLETPLKAPETPNGDRSWTSIEVLLCGGMLLFTLIVLALEMIIIVKAPEPWSPQSVLRVFGLTMILALSVLLIAAGYSKDQTSPVMGLLGVIAGYLLGNNDRATESREPGLTARPRRGAGPV